MSTTSAKIKQGDNTSWLKFTPTDRAGNVLTTTQADIYLVMRKVGTTTSVSIQCQDGGGGTVKAQISTEKWAELGAHGPIYGVYECECYADCGEGNIVIIPSDGYNKLEIVRSLGAPQ